jgi:hypothetical protein
MRDRGSLIEPRWLSAVDRRHKIMNRFLDTSLVVLALLASGWYALSSLGPRSLRTRLWGVLARAAARAPSFLQLGGLARRLEAAGKVSGACGGCGSCASDQPAAEVPTPEVRVPVAKIGKRG